MDPMQLAEHSAPKQVSAISDDSVPSNIASSVLLEIVDTAIAIVGADFGNIQLLDPETGDLKIVAHRGFPQWWLDYWETASKGKGACGTALERVERVIVEDVEHDPIFAGTPGLDIQLKAGIRAVQSTPIVSRSRQCLGMFSTHYRTPRSPDKRELHLLDLLAHQAADIIGRAQAEMALRASEERLRRVFDNASMGLIRCSRDWLYLSANTAYAEIVGKPLDQIVGRSHAEVLGPAAVETIRPYVERALRGERVVYESEVPFSGAGPRYLHVSYSPDTNADGQIAGWIGCVTDITERKRSEIAMRESEAHLRLSAQAAHIGLWDWDLQANRVFYSTEWKTQIGYRDEQISDQFDEWKSRVHPDDLEPTLQKVRDFIAHPHGRHEAEFRFRHKDGRYLWILTFADVLLDREGRPTHLLGCHLDITERKRIDTALHESETQLRNLNATLEQRVVERTKALGESEQRLSLALGAARMGTFDWDIVTGKVLWSQETERIWGLPQGGFEGTYEHWLRMIHPEDLATAEARAQQALTELDAAYEFEHRIVWPGGEVRWVLARSTIVRDTIGRPVRIVGVNMDITERKRAEEALARANASLEARVAERTRLLEQEMKLREHTQAALAQSQRMEALGQLTGGIAHDFNNLLMVISGNLEFAEAGMSDGGAKDAVRKAIDAAEMGASLNRRLLSFARRRTLAPQRMILNERVSEVQSLLRRTLGEDVALHTEIEPSLWSTMADPGEIDSAIVNIAINARDAMPGGGTLTVATRNVTLDEAAANQGHVRAGDYVCLSLSDTGHGMTPEVLRRAIEPFFTTKETGKGTGLGLSSVYAFAQQSGGFLHIASDVGKGTTVSLYLPSGAEAPIAAGPALSKEDLPRGDAELILVVEDNDQVREVTLGRLEALGYAVLEARSGPEAIDILQSEHGIELVLSDVVMPGGMSGYDVADWITAQRPDIKILLASGHNSVSTDRQQRLGIRLLAKPYSRVVLAHAIREALDS